MRRVGLDPGRSAAIVRDFAFWRLGKEALSSAYEAVVPVRKRTVRDSFGVDGDQDHETRRSSERRNLCARVGDLRADLGS